MDRRNWKIYQRQIKQNVFETNIKWMPHLVVGFVNLLRPIEICLVKREDTGKSLILSNLPNPFPKMQTTSSTWWHIRVFKILLFLRLMPSLQFQRTFFRLLYPIYTHMRVYLQICIFQYNVIRNSCFWWLIEHVTSLIILYKIFFKLINI